MVCFGRFNGFQGLEFEACVDIAVLALLEC